MTSGEHVIIADIEFLDAPNVVPVISSFSERERIYRRHPEMVDREHAIVQTFRTPGMVIRDTVQRDTLNFFADFGSRHHILVSVCRTSQKREDPTDVTNIQDEDEGCYVIGERGGGSGALGKMIGQRD